jgi:hypothetical protein
MRLVGFLTAAALVSAPSSFAAAHQPPAAAPAVAPATNGYADLVALHAELSAYMAPGFTGSALLDSGARAGDAYAEPLVRAKLAGLAPFEARLTGMDVASWPRGRQVEWLATRSLLNGYRFKLEVLRPWRRDPGFYLDPLLQVAFAEVPARGERLDRLRAQLRAIPLMLKGAQGDLDEVAGDFADLALHNLDNSDGVNHAHPYRSVPPAGIIGWYDDLLARARTRQPELLPAIRDARAAVVEFRDWLRSRRPRMVARAGVGPSRFQWYITHVRMIPYSTAEMLNMAQREHERLTAALALTRHRNRHLPQLQLSRSAAEQEAKVAETDKQVRDFLRREDIVTIPDYVGTLGSNAPWIERPGGPNFWEQIQFRDPIPDHLHAVIPGHRFDAEIAERDKRPIRGAFSDGVRAEGWATYLEETLSLAGAPVSPRAAEFIQLFGIFRAARVPADIRMQHNQWSVTQAVSEMRRMTPWLDRDVARVDAEIYLREPPGYGLAYTIGKFQMDALLAARAQQLGDRFALREFHDQFLAAGRLPIALIRYEMTGEESDIRRFWQTPPLPPAD